MHGWVNLSIMPSFSFYVSNTLTAFNFVASLCPFFPSIRSLHYFNYTHCIGSFFSRSIKREYGIFVPRAAFFTHAPAGTMFKVHHGAESLYQRFGCLHVIIASHTIGFVSFVWALPPSPALTFKQWLAHRCFQWRRTLHGAPHCLFKLPSLPERTRTRFRKSPKTPALYTQSTVAAGTTDDDLHHHYTSRHTVYIDVCIYRKLYNLEKTKHLIIWNNLHRLTTPAPKPPDESSIDRSIDRWWA